MKPFISIFFIILLLTSCSNYPSIKNSTRVADTTLNQNVHNQKIIALLQDSKKLTSSSTMTQLVEKAIQNSNDPEPLYNLAYAHMRNAQITKNIHEHDLAINYFKEVLVLVPGNQAALMALYNIYYDDTLHNRQLLAFEQAKHYFFQIPIAIQETSNPPSLAKYAAVVNLQETQRQPDHKVLRGILLNAIQEQPLNHHAYIQLAKLYSEDGYYALALATLKLGAENIHDSAELYSAIAATHEQRANIYNCSYEQPQDIVKAATYYKLAIPLAPDNASLHYNLSGDFFDQNLNNLGLHELHIALTLDSSSSSLSLAAQHYSNLGHITKANHFLEEAISKGFNIHNASYHEINMNQGNWQKAAEGFAAYIKTRTHYSVYDVIKNDIIAQQTSQAARIDNTLVTFNNDWEENLFNFWTAKINDAELKKRAINRCEKTEYYFYSGYQDLQAGKTAQAHIKFAETLKQNTYRFIERPLAQHFLQK